MGVRPPASPAVPSQGEPPPTWTVGQLRHFLEVTAEHTLHPLWITVAMTGISRNEVLAIRGQDVLRDRIAIRRCVQVGTERTRWLELDPPRARAVHVDEEVIRRLRGVGTEDLVFGNGTSGVPSPRQVSQDFDAACAAYGLPRIGLRGLRDTHAVLLLRTGAPIGLVSQRLGHATVTATLRRYGSVVPSDDADVARCLSRMVLR